VVVWIVVAAVSLVRFLPLLDALRIWEAWVNLVPIAPPPGQAIIESYTAPAANGFALRVDNGFLQAWALGGPNEGYSVVTGRTRRSEEHTSELQSRDNLVCRLWLETNI